MKRLWICFTILILLVGCASTPAVDLKGVYERLSKEMDLPKLVEIDQKAAELVYEFDMKTIKQFAIYRPLTNVQVDEVILIEAQKDQVLAVKEKVDQYLQMSEEYWKDFLPSQYELLKDRKELLIQDYYCVVIGKKAQEVIDALEKELRA
ncbi:MAG: DUF4358 domain-containing protein [Erysipelotrichaceae bacterium]|nr:DUF4358 domain-containing protein [Erysipelotrichaceae bacterium]